MSIPKHKGPGALLNLVARPYKYDIPQAIWNLPLTRRGRLQPKFAITEVDQTMDNESKIGSDGMDNFLSDLANAIPGIYEAMGFAKMNMAAAPKRIR
ncbi:hypothetical protein T459_28155 [Capsicum annuum]|uniref:Uncharacterized protein n=1 Tax=Capsicum annuum TaxID=4072 RepID=A0A2G2YFY6_CAPAN|nr:hypothetical protein T459_28155 [Capsicum annuum]